jgi:predicted TIM-barrel fold metal-dependent hydrolase
VSVRSIIRAQLDELAVWVPAPFDVHAHTGADIDGTVRSSEEHVADLAPVDGRSVVFPLCVTTGYRAQNERVIAEARRYPERLVPFARLDPKVDSAAAASEALTAGARGFKLHPRGDSFRLEHPNVDAILAVAAEAGVPALIHAGRGVGSFGPVLTELAARHRRCPVILAHAGISDLAWLASIVGAHPNLFFDTAWWNPTDLLALFSVVPPGQILHGSDAPYGDVELNLVITLRCGLAAGLSAEQLALVTGGQLERLLRGASPAHAGPAPRAGLRASRPSDARVAAFLTAAGGALAAGGDPREMLELALLAIEPTDAATPPAEDDLIRGLLEAIDPTQPAAMRNALVLALTLSATSGVDARHGSGIGVPEAVGRPSAL